MKDIYYLVNHDLDDEGSSHAVAVFIDKLTAVEFAEDLMKKELGISLSIKPINREDLHEWL